MVWSDNRRGSDWDIYGFDFFSRAEKPICRAEGDQLNPQASGSKVVWSDYRNGDSDIYMVDTATGVESAIASGKGDQVLPSISGDRIVWMDNSSGDWDVYLHENKKGNGTTRPVYKGQGQQMYPVISGDLIVWQDSRNGNADVYVYDLKNSSETKLTGDGDQISPQVSGNTIVWEDAKTGDISYYLWDKKWGRTYPRPGIQSSPVASGKYIAYVDNADKNASIRKLDTSNWKDELVAAGPGQVKPSMDKKLVWLNSMAGRPRSMTLAAGQTSVVCQAPGDQSHPSVGGNNMVGYYVVWMDNRSNNSDVYVYSLTQELELPLIASPFPELYPDITENIIAWSAYDPLKNWWTVRTFGLARGQLRLKGLQEAALRKGIGACHTAVRIQPARWRKHYRVSGQQGQGQLGYMALEERPGGCCVHHRPRRPDVSCNRRPHSCLAGQQERQLGHLCIRFQQQPGDTDNKGPG
jgi:beta propeller repeat protein